MNEIEEETYTVTISKCATTGQRLSQVWRKNGLLDNPYGPAEVSYVPKTQMPWRMTHWINGKRSRLDGPALIIRDKETGNIAQTTHFVDGKLHSEGKPTTMIFNEVTGEPEEASYFRNGKCILEITVAPLKPT